MKRIIWKIAFITFACVVLYAGIISAESRGNLSSNLFMGERSISVIGEGKVTVSPDAVEIHIGVEVFDPDVQNANKKVTTIMDSLLSVLHDIGIEEQNIQTSHFGIWFDPGYRRLPDDTEISTAGQYRVSNEVKITVTDIENVSSVIDRAVQVGANRIWGVNFIRKDLSHVYEEASAEAMQDAETRATQLAELGGVQLGEILSISENTNIYSSSYPYGGTGGSLPPGELEYTLQIRVTYKIE